MAVNTETEPVIPTRNFVDSYFVETLRSPTLGYATGFILLAATAAVLGGTYETVSEGFRAATMVREHNFAETIRSGLAVVGAEVAVVTGIEVIRSYTRVWNHPLSQSLYQYHDRLRSDWNKRRKEWNFR